MLAAREQTLREENNSLRQQLERVSDAAQRREDALKLAEERLRENKALQERLDKLSDTVRSNEQALKAAEDKLQKAMSGGAEERTVAPPPRRPVERGRNPLRYDEDMKRDGMVSYFERENM